MHKTVRAAIYARISRDISGERLGVDRQVKDCRKLADDRGWTVIGEYVDNDISAFAGKHRPEYERMLEDLTDGGLDAVIVYNLDRLTRRPMELEQFTEVCKDAGVTQLVAVTGDINIGNDDGMFMARMYSAVAAKESGRKSERLKRKAIELAEAGKPNGLGHRPFGYAMNQLELIEPEAVIVKEAAERYLAGESLASLTNWIKDSGASTVSGAEWRTTTLRNTLKSPRIAGLRSLNGTIIGPAIWPAIITPEQHYQLIATFARKTSSGRRVPRRYVLSGLLRCGNCGGKMFSSVRVDIRRYVCMSGPDHGGCGRMSIVAAPIEEWITEAVLIRLDSPAMADALRGRAAADERFGALSASLQSDQEQMAELAAMWADKAISSAEWKAAREPIEARIHSTDRQLRKLSSSDALSGLVGNADALRDRWATLNLTRQAAIIAAVMDHAVVNSATKRGRGLDPSRVLPSWAR